MKTKLTNVFMRDRDDRIYYRRAGFVIDSLALGVNLVILKYY